MHRIRMFYTVIWKNLKAWLGPTHFYLSYLTIIVTKNTTAIAAITQI